MFDKFSDAAEKLATSVSRRGFLSSLAGWAAAAALGLAAVLSGAGSAQAGNYKCCIYGSSGPVGSPGCALCVSSAIGCPNLESYGWTWLSAKSIGSCTDCYKKYCQCLTTGC